MKQAIHIPRIAFPRKASAPRLEAAPRTRHSAATIALATPATTLLVPITFRSSRRSVASPQF